MRVSEIRVKRIRVNQGLGVGAQKSQSGPIAWPSLHSARMTLQFIHFAHQKII